MGVIGIGRSRGKGGSASSTEINVKSYGAKGDNVTDDTAAIQAAIDYALDNKISTVIAPNGRYKISKPIHLGYGEDFKVINFIGEGMQLKNESYAGTVIDASSFSNAPAIVFQGVRNSSIKNMSIVGANMAFIKDNDLGNLTCTVDDLLESDWIGGGLHANANSDTAPYAGIAVDPYSGTAPATAYPDVEFPSYTGISTQYGKSFSGRIKIENVAVSGFIVGLVTQPSGTADGNGDFVSFEDIKFSNNVYNISIGQTQARQLNIYGNSELSSSFTSITSTRHGKKTGMIRGSIDGVGFGTTINLFDVNVSYGSLTLTGCYAESIYRFGNIGVNSVNNQPVTLNGCQLSFSGQNSGLRGSPKYTFEGDNASILLNGCTISNADGYNVTALIAHPGLNIETINSKVKNNDTAPTTAAEAVIKNFQQGGIMLTKNGVLNFNPQFRSYNVDTYSSISFAFQSTNQLANALGRNLLLPQNAKNIPFDNDFHNYVESYFETGGYINTNSWTEISTDGMDVSVNIGTTDNGRAYAKIDLGDAIFHNETMYYVHSRTGNVVVLRALSNYDKDGELNSTITASGDAKYWHARKFAIKEVYYADFVADSTTVNYYRAYDRYVGAFGGEISVNDRLMLTGEMIGVFANKLVFPKITAIDTGAGTLTLSDAPKITRAGIKLTFFSRTFTN